MLSHSVYTSAVQLSSSQWQLIRYAAAPFPRSDTDQTACLRF